MKGLTFIQKDIDLIEKAHKIVCTEFTAAGKNIYNELRTDYSVVARTRYNEIMAEFKK